MDMEEDTPQDTPQINKDDEGSIPTGSSRSQDPSRAATSSHEKPNDQDDRLASAPSRRRGPSSRSSKSTATASSPSASSSRPAPVSRRSTTSSESMDPGGYGGHAQGSTSGGSMPTSSMPTRPLGNVPGEGGVPVKLTPITGRVSRAKKGVPVHTCDICKPPKTFTRAEHLRRHQLSHRNPGFPCTYPGCDKAFHRADLLARHAQRHEHDDKSSRGNASRRTSAASLDDAASGIYIGHTSPMSGGSSSRPVMPGPSDMNQGATYPGSLSPYPMGNSGGSGGQAAMSPPQHHGRGSEGYQSTSNPSSHSYVLSSSQAPISIISNPGIGDSSVTGTPFGLEFQPRTSPSYSMFMDTSILPQDLPSLTIPDNSMPPGLIAAGHDGSPWPSSASESNYSTPSEISHRRNITRGYESPTSDWPVFGGAHHLNSPGGGLDAIPTSAPFFGNAFSPTASNLDQALNLPMPFSDDPSFVEHPQQYHHYSSVRSPTPPTISLSAQPAENLVTLAPPISDAASTGGRQKGSAVFLGPIQGTAFLTANTLPPHVRNAIPKYLTVYWKRFDTLFPLVHRKSVKTAADEILRCAMAAVGTQFLQSKEDRIRGNELHEFAWKEVQTCTQWNLQVMQAILLCEFYARFRGRSVQRSASEPFQSLYSRMANHLIPDDFLFSASTRNERWNEWIDNESRRRLLTACFVLDVHTSVYYQQHLIQPFPMSTHPIPLIRPTQDLWAAQSPEAWEDLVSRRPDATEPSSFSGETPTADQVTNAPYLDHALFLVSEVLRLPKRSSPSILDLSTEVDPTSTERLSRLFAGSAVANTYLALHYTPLHDLLAVSGDTWLFSKKIASPLIFQQHKRRLQLWCGSRHAGAAAGFAAKGLLAYLDHTDYSNYNTLNTTVSSTDAEEEDEEDQGRGRSWSMLDISDYWAMYVCALICWALGQRPMARTGSGPRPDFPSNHHNNHHNSNANANAGEKGERESIKWLKLVASLSAEKALTVRSRKESIGVISMVRRRLEDEAVGGKNRLLVDAMGTLKKLEERVGYKWLF
ncbi:hypothetical protein F5Y04DRAFT_275145 [Hypomontagnella monticulosa]|nr:hypothetical protein F5Y04DRAFT_275145 [Hypomontagnella monticulosa]